MHASSSFETLASVLESGARASLTTVDRHGLAHTSPVRPLRTSFDGHLWLDLGCDDSPARDIADGSEVTVAYGDASNGPYVTVNGWAVVMPHCGSEGTQSEHPCAGSRAAAGERTPLVCVIAHAAELWEDGANGARRRGRVFAFAPTREEPEDSLPGTPHVISADNGRVRASAF